MTRKRAAAATFLLIAAFSVGAASQPEAPEPAEERIELLQQIVGLRERQEMEFQYRFDTPALERSAVTLRLLEARARLARARGDREALAWRLEELVELHTRRVQEAESLYVTGRMSRSEVQEVEISLLEAKLDRLNMLGD